MSTATAAPTPAPGQAPTPTPTSTASRRRPPRQRAGMWARWLVLVVIALLFISPLVFMLLTSFKTRADATSLPPQWLPEEWTLQAYESILGATATPVFTWFLNSMLAAALHAALVVVTATLAAYPLARMQFRGKGIVFGAVIATLLVPPVILIIPNYLIVSELGWLNSLMAVIVPTAASAFGVFLMRQFFLSLPPELEEAARLDGANPWSTFVHIILPLAKPAIATLALLAFLGNWNDFLWPVYVLFNPDVQTLPAGLATLQSANAVRYDLLMAGAVIASAPVLLLYVLLQRFIVEGVSRSGIKG
ncbi:carbohydrate ABC transporter permease [Agrococcus jenensis]|uniref:Carbohydrate ABC transporter membrane protein 2 (CUT1 family) n=1 Tax=Agrococcus jenensis TaxID=46353 RepID=A0A3N2AQ71_9MICO|nr:carbohydrate ABC transporter permease [Agrococcus jenensis]ROR65203.1 carbohydrate ABC transporter membrane protein 2 (CUT1 family) [Agrococcus jenensis]